MTDIFPHRSPDLLARAESLLLVVDIQERLLPRIGRGEEITSAACRLLAAARLFELPAIVSQQYPRGLGETVPAVREAASGVAIVDKLRFSAAGATGWPMAAERDDGRTQVVIAGIETHICVLQTACDLLSWGYRVYLAADGVGSQRDGDHQAALQRLRDAGATITTSEAILFEWCEEAGTDQFREMRSLL